MSTSWLFIVLAGLVFTLLLLLLTYLRLRKQKKLIHIQSAEIERQLRELVKQNEIQQQLNFEKQQTIGIVSHDLKGPFNRIFALVQLIDLVGTLTEEQKEYMGKIHQITVDGLSMLRNLLDNRKLEDKRMDMVPEELNLSLHLSGLIKNYRAVAAKKNIEIKYEAPSAAPVRADKIFVTRIFENLLSNAVKFSPSGKTVTVSVKEENDWVIEVKDEGPGFTEDDLQKIFQKFQPLSARPTSGESSTGLGLWIAKSLVEKMSGSIECESKSGEGAKFSVRLMKK